MIRRLALLAAVAVVILAAFATPSAAKAPTDIRSVVVDKFLDVDPADITTPPCSGGVIETLPNGFRFHEVQEDSGSAVVEPAETLGYPAGYLSSGCGTAVLTLRAPGPYDHVHIRFDADRRVDEFEAAGRPVNPDDQAFTQVIELANSAGALAPTTYELFALTTGSSPAKNFDIRSSTNPGDNFTATWRFSDGALFLDGNQAVFTSGEDYQSDVTDIKVEFSGIPLAYHAEAKPTRHGTVYVSQTKVTLATDGVGDSDVRVEIGNALTFAWVQAPDGTRISSPTTRTGPGPDAWNRDFALVERPREDVSWITVPREFLAAHGAGNYTVAFTSVESFETQPWLIPLVALVLVTPLPFAIVAYRKVRAFEQEAFGAYKRSARNLRISLIVAVLYYATVVVSSVVGSGLALLVIWPLPLEAIVTYVQVVVAIAAFVALCTVAKELDSITRPREPTTA